LNATFWRLLKSEFERPDANLALSIALVAAAVATVTLSFSLLALQDISAERKLEAASAENTPVSNTPEKTREGNDQGFNALILPNGVGTLDVQAGASDVFASAPRFFSAANAFGNARQTFPVLERGIRWREENCNVILCGMGDRPTRSESAESVVMGAALADTLFFKSGDDFLFNGEPMKIKSVRPEKGDLGDITIWTSLKTARRLLRMPGKINGVFVFGCSNAESLAEGARRFFPNARILKFSTDAEQTRREKSSNKLERKSVTDLLAGKLARARSELENKLAVFCSAAILALAAWFFALNVFHIERNAAETSFLLALGTKKSALFALELIRGGLVLLMGTACGFSLGIAITVIIGAGVQGIQPELRILKRAFDLRVDLWVGVLTALVVMSAVCATALKIFSISHAAAFKAERPQQKI